MNTYKTKYNNHYSEEKQICRDKVFNYVKELSKQDKVKVLTLPSTNFILEQELLKLSNVKLTCVEKETEIFKQQNRFLRGKVKPRMFNTDVFHYLQQQMQRKPQPYDVIWLDLCGPLQVHIINNFLSLVQSPILNKTSYVTITILGKREPHAKQIAEFYNCKNIEEFRMNKFPALAQEFAHMAGKNCELIDTYKYKSGFNTSMIMLTFKISN